MNSVVLPLRTLGPNGSHGHWRTLAARRKRERMAGFAGAALVAGVEPTLPCAVTLTRLSAGELDGDNLQGALKGVRDGVADRLGVDDRDPRVIWEYGQEHCRRGEFGVRIEIRPLGGDEEGDT